MAREVAETSVLTDPEQSPFSATITDGQPDLVLITGENGGGKSLFFRVLASWVRNHWRATPVTISIRERTGGGLYEGAGFRRAMMFGDEAEQSTGATSAKAVQTGFRSVQHYAAEGNPGVLLLDEPEMGLSAGYAYALGEFIAREAAILAAPAKGVVVVSHSRDLVRGMLAAGASPTFVNMNAAASLQDWLNNPEVRTVADLLQLAEMEHSRWQAVNKLLKSKN